MRRIGAALAKSDSSVRSRESNMFSLISLHKEVKYDALGIDMAKMVRRANFDVWYAGARLDVND